MTTKPALSKTTKAWIFYDWANSVYPLIISSAIFPVFYESITQKDLAGRIQLGSFIFYNTEFYSYVVALSYLVVAIISPVLSGLADVGGHRKTFLKLFCYLGAFSSAALSLFNTQHVLLSMSALLLASIGFWGSLVFYNAYLPEIAAPEDQDRISARGFAMGYLGSSILLLTILIVCVFLKWVPIRFAFLGVGAWWLSFAQVTFRYLPPGKQHSAYRNTKQMRFKSSFLELKKVWGLIRLKPLLYKYLTAYFMFNMGVQTVMIMAVPFAAKAIQWSSDQEKQSSLVVSILLIQFLGIAGSFLSSRISKSLGNVLCLLVLISAWLLLCIGVWQWVYTPLSFYITASVVGFLMGGTQALARSTYSKMLPDSEDHTSFFSFFDVSEKIGLVIGTSSFGIIEGLTGGIRNSVLSVTLAFCLGLWLLFRVYRQRFKQSS